MVEITRTIRNFLIDLRMVSTALMAAWPFVSNMYGLAGPWMKNEWTWRFGLSYIWDIISVIGQMSMVMVFKLQSKKISNDQELIQSDPTSCPQNQKGNK